jgi:hypothetical protein
MIWCDPPRPREWRSLELIADLVSAKKAVPLAAHTTAYHRVNLTVSNVLG